MHRTRLTSVLLLAVALTVSVSMTSCGGGEGGQDPDLVLVGFNLPNISGIPLNEALIFTFSAAINPATITPDSLRVVGTEGPFFETTVVDGNLVALLPRSPNFDTYEDAGLLPGINYSVSMTVFPAVTTIETVTGKPLLEAEAFTFTTLPFPVFVEPRRPIVHGVPWTLGGESDDAGCLQNSGNSLYESPATEPTSIQTGSTIGATLLCLQNEGPPRVILDACVPAHNSFNIGTPSAVNTGEVDMPAIRIRLNENLDPLSVTPYTPTTQLPINVQLWRVAQKDGTYIDPPEPIPTNEPVLVQNLDQTEVILVPSKSVGQGLYLVNLTPSVKDLPGNALRIDDRPDPVLDGFKVYEDMASFGLNIQPGWRMYFRTLELPSTPLAIIEDFASNLKEWGDNDSVADEPGVYSASVLDAAGLPADNVLDGETMADQGFGDAPNVTLVFSDPDPLGEDGGQSTTANWNGNLTAGREDPITDVDGYRFLNIPTLRPNPNSSNTSPGKLIAVHQPWAGSGADGAFVSDGTGSSSGWNTDTGSSNGDGVWEVESFNLQAADTINVTGSRPLLILCQGDFTLNGTMNLSGQKGEPGFDTDGSSDYDPAATGAAAAGGAGGVGGPGGGAGGNGANPTASPATIGSGGDGFPGRTLFDEAAGTTGGGGPDFIAEDSAGTNDRSYGGGGGGFANVATAGTRLDGSSDPSSTGGDGFSDARFERDLDLFEPDRGYHPSAGISGGSGGGGGSADDDNGTSETGNTTAENGDDGGGGGGGAGGGIWVIARGSIVVGSTAVVNCNGGRGGNTYARAQQDIADGVDGASGGGDDFLVGAIDDTLAGTGDGGPGGGGAGGAIFCVARGDITVDGSASLTALPGAGGTSGAGGAGSGLREGGAGSEGRITLMLMEGSTGSITAPASAFDPLPLTFSTPNGWQPTIDEASVAQSEWVDLFTANSLFNRTATNGEGPSFHGNFNAAGTGALQLPVASGGGGKALGTDFDFRIEFQGADDLGVFSGGGNPHPQGGANGLTQWFDIAVVSPAVGGGAIDNKRFFRWRWRFWVEDGWGMSPGDPANLPLPTVLDFTIPFVKP